MGNKTQLDPQLRKTLEHISAVGEAVRNQGGEGVCKAMYLEAVKDPVLKAAIEKAELKLLEDSASIRIPFFGSWIMAKDIVAYGNSQYKKGDTAAAISNYSAATAVAASSFVAGWWPMVSDGLIELMRAGGAPLQPSPAAKAIDTAAGVKNLCTDLDDKAKVAIISPEKALMMEPLRLQPEQQQAVKALMQRVIDAYSQQKTEVAQTPPASTPRGEPPIIMVQSR